jgi:hypothetical protein
MQSDVFYGKVRGSKYSAPSRDVANVFYDTVPPFAVSSTEKHNHVPSDALYANTTCYVIRQCASRQHFVYTRILLGTSAMAGSITFRSVYVFTGGLSKWTVECR